MKTIQERLSARYIPAGYKVYQQNDAAIVYIAEDGLTAKMFKGTAAKPVFWTKFNTQERLIKVINDYYNRFNSWEEMKTARQLRKKNEVAELKVGDLLHYAWGYDQTQCEFFQVTSTTGKSFTMREIGGKHIRANSDMSEFRSPIKNAFLSDSPEITKTSLSMKCGGLNLTHEGREHYCSWYA
jgi:hypothetical protein